MPTDTLTYKKLKLAVHKLQKNNVPSEDGFYFADIHPVTLIDMLLTYKRPRASKLYKQLRRHHARINNEIGKNTD